MGLVAYVTSQRLDVVEDKFEFDVEDYWENKLFDQTFVSKHKCLIKLILVNCLGVKKSKFNYLRCSKSYCVLQVFYTNISQVVLVQNKI